MSVPEYWVIAILVTMSQPLLAIGDDHLKQLNKENPLWLQVFHTIGHFDPWKIPPNPQVPSLESAVPLSRV